MGRCLLFVCALTACGRIGFDPDGPDGGHDGGGILNALDPCTAVPQLAVTPILDGILEPRLALHPIPWPPPWYGIAGAPLPEVRTSYALAWTATGLYVFVEVGDPDVWPAVAQDPAFCGDSFELYVDSDAQYASAPDYDAAGTRQFIARAAIDTISPRTEGEIYRTGELLGAWTGGFVTTAGTGVRHLEAFIDGPALGLAWAPSAGQQIGFDLSTTLSAPDGVGPIFTACPGQRRLGQYHLRIDDTPTSPCVHPHCNVNAFCRPRLD